MQQLTALRPLVTASAAALGASLIALTPTVFNDAAATLQHGAITAQQRAVQLVDDVVNPIQTWIDTFQTAGANIQTILGEFSQLPFPVAQQLAANWLDYGNIDISNLQSVAGGLVGYYLGARGSDFVPLLEDSITAARAGQFALTPTSDGAVTLLVDALYYFPVANYVENLKNIPVKILEGITQNLANATSAFFSTHSNVGFDAISGSLVLLPTSIDAPLGDSLQGAYDSWVAGSPLGVLTNLLDIPGEMTNSLLNLSGVGGGLVCPGSCGLTNGFFQNLLVNVPRLIAENMVAPGAQNITEGGSVATAFQQLSGQLISGWPTLQTVVDYLVNLWNTYGGVGNVAAASAGAVNGGSLIGGLSAQLPGLSADLLKGFDPAAVTNIAGSLGPSLAADVAGSLGTSVVGSLGSVAGTLAVDLSTLGLHILSAL
ncbi:hypothetical protein K3U93_05560 [Mycobacterium malmoense]|uniref:PE-PGRS family protein n=1 Tax=Mycobacterium malmoense TaxID=1780 RepID=A0ABX3SLF9_MYCMA|nr:hypothetical protein [Mycobacterium malmoense]OIN79201.1 hypothetical protein BMG05_19245 [Mycobacterium malmoense]ORA76483.1 hypothetical protein BST29_24510 [Mycobacterium malmoense]QZA18655.1 hypothetical protein K3U93_05560 [Mycobacterium malmoense]UNB95427.1 hypothetical protein H5T25_05550 [Mycobacterium malmoense]